MQLEQALGGMESGLAADRGRRVAAFFDVDGTLVGGQSVWRGLWDYHQATRRNRGRMLSFVMANSARALLYACGLWSRDRFVATSGERLAGIFAGLTPDEAGAMFAWIWENSLRSSLRADVVARLRAHQKAGHLVALVSATLQGLVEVVAERLGGAVAVGSQLEVHDGRYTGQMVRPLCFGEHKATRARAVMAAAGGVDLPASFAYADSAHDVPLLALVGHPTAVYPDSDLLALARARGWEVLGEREPRRQRRR